jgi:hypothetical protein
MIAGRAAERGYCAVHDSSGNSDEDDDESDIHIFAVYQVNGYKNNIIDDVWHYRFLGQSALRLNSAAWILDLAIPLWP